MQTAFSMRVFVAFGFLTVTNPSTAYAEKFLSVYLGFVKVGDASGATPGQKTKLRELMEGVRLELKKSRRVLAYSPEELDSWYLDRDWKSIADQEKTHFIVAIPKARHDSVRGDFLNISWEVGAIGAINGQQVPVFAGALTEGIEAKILKDKDGEGAFIEGLSPRDKAAVVAQQMRRIFPELDTTFRYYVSCFEPEDRPAAARASQWSERRERLLTTLLSRLTARNELQHTGASDAINPMDEARTACRDDGTMRETVKASADFLLRGVASRLSASTFTIRVTVDNKPGRRRLLNSLTDQPNQFTTEEFYKQLVTWMQKYEGNTPWELSVCGSSNDFWATPPRIEMLAERLATMFEQKLPIEMPASAAVPRGSC